MAAVTTAIGSAGGGQFVVSLTYDDVTGLILSVSSTLLSGSASLIWDGQVRGVFPIGVSVLDVAAFARPLNKGHGIGFTWGAS